MTSPEATHEGFTVGLALVDAIPVLLFGVSAIVIGARWGNVLFLIGAVAMFVGGASKVLWKLLIGMGKGDKPLLAKLFRPLMFGGFALVLIAIVIYNNAPALKNFRESHNLKDMILRRKKKAQKADTKEAE